MSSTPGPVSRTSASARKRSSPEPSRASSVAGRPGPRSRTAVTVPLSGARTSSPVTGPGQPVRAASASSAWRVPHSWRVRRRTSARLAQSRSSRPSPRGTGARIRSGRGSQANTERRATTTCSAAASTCRWPAVDPATRSGSSAVPSRSSGSGARVTPTAPPVSQAAWTERRPGSRRAVANRICPSCESRSPTIRRVGSAWTARSSRTGPAGPSTVQPSRKPRRRCASGSARSGMRAAASGKASSRVAPAPSPARAS